ncbi:phosphatidylinositol transfer protein, beta, like isoform X1 [Amia ocellicauda]|uniref:phosphatidylinositol transfer protein, beta, like isoform X1 n=1 Tax=Amia ocellicauda TaxID=2972642 RepID=UPI00346435D4
MVKPVYHPSLVCVHCSSQAYSAVVQSCPVCVCVCALWCWSLVRAVCVYCYSLVQGGSVSSCVLPCCVGLALTPPPVHRLSLQNEYMKDDFFIKIETWHKPDMGTTDNVHGLSQEVWEEAEVVPIDIADRTQVADDDYKPDEDPAVFHSEKTGRGPLGPGWKKELYSSDWPHMTAYKLVTVHFRWWGLQGRVEKFIHKQEKRLFTNFHRQLFCWIDRWVDLSMEDIRRMEEETQRELDQMRNQGSVRGMKAGDD